MDVNSLPKTVTRQRRGCDLNPGLSAPESSTLTTRLPRRRRQRGFDGAAYARTGPPGSSTGPRTKSAVYGWRVSAVIAAGERRKCVGLSVAAFDRCDHVTSPRQPLTFSRRANLQPQSSRRRLRSILGRCPSLLPIHRVAPTQHDSPMPLPLAAHNGRHVPPSTSATESQRT